MDRTSCKAQIWSRTSSKFVNYYNFFAVAWISAESSVTATSPLPNSSSVVWRKDKWDHGHQTEWTPSLCPKAIPSLPGGDPNAIVLFWRLKPQCFMDKKRRNVHSTMVSNSQALPFHKPTAFPQWVFPGSRGVTLSIWNQSVNSWQLPETPHSISCSLPLPSFPPGLLHSSKLQATAA